MFILNGFALPEIDAGVQVVQLVVTVDPADWVGVFNQIEVWRSTTGAFGIYDELTADGYKTARLPIGAPDAPAIPVIGGLVVLVGKTLVIDVLDVEIGVTFTGVDPLTRGDAAAQIGAAGAGLVTSYVTTAGVLVVETTGAGDGASLKVEAGDAASLLGLPQDEPVYGKPARLAIKPTTSRYVFVDLRGSSKAFYRTRLRNQATGNVSAFSQPFSFTESAGLDPSHVVMGTLELVGLDGRPLSSVEVNVYLHFQSMPVDGKLVAESQLSKITDGFGRVAFPLVRGSRLTVAISGTDIIREITVPVDPGITTFPLLSAESGATDDVFKVQRPVLVVAERRSL